MYHAFGKRTGTTSTTEARLFIAAGTETVPTVVKVELSALIAMAHVPALFVPSDVTSTKIVTSRAGVVTVVGFCFAVPLIHAESVGIAPLVIVPADVSSFAATGAAGAVSVNVRLYCCSTSVRSGLYASTLKLAMRRAYGASGTSSRSAAPTLAATARRQR